MATAERVLWETITVIAFVLLLAGTLFWSSNRVDRHRDRLEQEFEARAAAAAEDENRRSQALEQDFERRAHEQSVREAKAVFRAFEAGVRSAVESGWGNYVGRAKTNLLAEPGVTFVHVLNVSGWVMASSDEKLARTGRIDERGDWAMSTTVLSVRDGATTGEIELAGPVGDGSGSSAVLWIGYDLEADSGDDG